jgi:hypothetical protein
MKIQVSWDMTPSKLVNNGVSQDVVSEESISSCVKKPGVCLRPSVFRQNIGAEN